MIEHPFLSFKNLSDDEILAKAIEIQGKLMKAHMWGSSQEIVGQLSWMMEMLEQEKGERAQKQTFEQMNQMFPDVIESEPDLQRDRADKSQGKEAAHGKALEKAEAAKPSKKISSFPTTFHKEYTKPDGKKDGK